MTNIEKIRDALVGGIDLAKSAGWTRHQKDEVAEAEEALRLFDEMTNRSPVGAPHLPQDVEEFIAKHAYQDGHDRFSCRCVSVEALTDWMTDWMSGHVRVPVGLLTKDGINRAVTEPKEVKGRVMSEMFWRGVYAAQDAMLNASKEGA